VEVRHGFEFLPTCVTSGKLLNLSESQYFIYKIEIIVTFNEPAFLQLGVSSRKMKMCVHKGLFIHSSPK
jgi:hypothetical protein